MASALTPTATVTVTVILATYTPDQARASARPRRLECVGARVWNGTDDGGVSSDHVPVAVDFVVGQS